MLSRNNVLVGTMILLILGGTASVYFQKHSKLITNEPLVSNLENQLFDTAWVELGENGEETGFEIDFRKTRENDPLNRSYDYQEYLHHRPGVSGYWKVKNDAIIITQMFDSVDLPPIIYTNVTIDENILSVTDSDSDMFIKFQRIP